ncbi:hypothetical protein FNF27_00852 [Cafeteria roenbergensis]|uniref:Peptidase M16 N-terminal domain-containing protein n=1 Tax=Cafeteria roenbergensis TaxID=33653 RepID=A0A5A8EP03_CAFRO|nr:hypothetical protein FNF27_00852 [Cafeteria roenbergensis]
MRVVLVSEPGCDDDVPADDSEAAVALGVAAGSFGDLEASSGLKPLQGRAHLTEHLLFMGSEKFTDENDYDSFMTEHGGECNAFTDTDWTCFHFTIRPSALAGGMERLAATMDAPLLRPETVKREVMAIESEFQQARLSDSVRAEQLLADEARPGHPASGFLWGNARSLATDPAAQGVSARDQVEAFVREQYLPSRMHLAIRAPMSLDAMQRLAETHFAGVGVGRAHGRAEPQPPVAAEPASAADSPSSCGPSGARWQSPVRSDPATAICRWLPVTNRLSLSMSWVLPPLMGWWKARPDEYVSHCLGHEGAGSLLSSLRFDGLVASLSAGVSGGGMDSNSLFSVFNVTIGLTAEGAADWAGVGAAVFAYLRLLRETGPQQRIWDELCLADRLQHDFSDEEEPGEHVQELATAMVGSALVPHPGAAAAWARIAGVADDPAASAELAMDGPVPPEQTLLATAVPLAPLATARPRIAAILAALTPERVRVSLAAPVFLPAPSAPGTAAAAADAVRAAGASPAPGVRGAANPDAARACTGDDDAQACDEEDGGEDESGDGDGEEDDDDEDDADGDDDDADGDDEDDDDADDAEATTSCKAGAAAPGRPSQRAAAGDVDSAACASRDAGEGDEGDDGDEDGDGDGDEGDGDEDDGDDEDGEEEEEELPTALPEKALESLSPMQMTNVEPWFGTSFRRDPLPDGVLELWNNPPRIAALALPLPNTFLPESLELRPPAGPAADWGAAALLAPDSDQLALAAKAADAIPSMGPALAACERAGAQLPALLESGPDGRLWWQQDLAHLVPFTALRAGIHLGPLAELAAAADVVACAAAELWVAMANDLAQEVVYTAHMAGLSLEARFSRRTRAVLIEVEGHSPKVPDLLRAFARALVAAGDPSRPDAAASFARLREIALRSAQGMLLKPLAQADAERLRLTFGDKRMHRDARLDGLAHVSLEDVARLAAATLGTAASPSAPSFFVEACIVGNETPSSARAAFSAVTESLLAPAATAQAAATAAPAAALGEATDARSALACSSLLLRSGLPRHTVALLPAGPVLCHRIVPVRPAERNAAVVLYFQAPGARTAQLNARLRLLETLMEEPLFDKLRTHEQLGYTVHCESKCAFGVAGLSVVLQGSRHSADHLLGRALAFLADWPLRALPDMPEDRFATHRSGLVDSLVQPPATVQELSVLVWDAVESSCFDFGMETATAEEVAKTSIADVAAFAATLFGEATRRCLAVLSDRRHAGLDAGELAALESDGRLRSCAWVAAADAVAGRAVWPGAA